MLESLARQIADMAPVGYNNGDWSKLVKGQTSIKTKSGATLRLSDAKRDPTYRKYEKLWNKISGYHDY